MISLVAQEHQIFMKIISRRKNIYDFLRKKIRLYDQLFTQKKWSFFLLNHKVHQLGLIQIFLKEYQSNLTSDQHQISILDLCVNLNEI